MFFFNKFNGLAFQHKDSNCFDVPNILKVFKVRSEMVIEMFASFIDPFCLLRMFKVILLSDKVRHTKNSSDKMHVVSATPR